MPHTHSAGHEVGTRKGWNDQSMTLPVQETANIAHCRKQDGYPWKDLLQGGPLAAIRKLGFGRGDTISRTDKNGSPCLNQSDKQYSIVYSGHLLLCSEPRIVTCQAEDAYMAGLQLKTLDTKSLISLPARQYITCVVTTGSWGI